MTQTPQFAAFHSDDRQGYGLVTERGLIDLSARQGVKWPTLREVIEAGRLAALAEEFGDREVDFAPGEFHWDIPIPAPEKIICVGVNYPDRNEEYKDGQAAQSNPSLFVRFPRSFVGHEAPIIRPSVSDKFDYEGEIAFVIGKPGRHIAEADALDHIAALTLCNEGSVRDWIRHAKFNVTQGKNFDTSGSLGPWLVPFTDESQIADVRLTTHVNGELRQDDRTSRMIFGFRKLITYISTFTTLVPGDIIVSGTPTGAGARHDPPLWLVPGDEVVVEAEGVGLLRNTVAQEDPAGSRS
ncbi:fumarylacetoacetate hydrolase family protein [Hoeflea sp. WL0058]|uniref:Fumarylacetoacetate hydrolase family protein n=1 Tax=Flavimaribacter sediminis TaxID=2865987 RepID=A0AAE2ZPY5_9HYPH|nr:fumarylacetoacetate hydrolase family protein [Flavimaribacter sediminis]MBW8640091.1 fumarylacetoacetate hydrolase family protein [Flavimaribacter sediminis]